MDDANFKLFIGNPPLSWADIQAIEAIVRNSAVVYAPFEEFDGASLAVYFREEHLFGSTFHAVLDRNILSELVQAAKGAPVSTPTQRASCALLALFQVANVLIEPGVGMIEYSDSSPTANTAEELAYLRAFDNVDPKLVADLALGRSQRFDPSLLELLPQHPPAYSKGDQLNEWRLQYCFALKIAMLQRTHLTITEKLKALAEWMWSSFSFGAAAHTFGAICFTGQYSGMLKGIGSGNLDRTLRGIRNAAWDMVILHYFTSHAVTRAEKDPLYLFCTHDRALRHMATLLINDGAPVAMEEHFFRACSGRLTREECRILADQYLDLAGRTEDPTRAKHRFGTSEEQLLKVLASLEAEFRSSYREAQADGSA